MKASDVIYALQCAIREHGDLEVRVSDDVSQRGLNEESFREPYFVCNSDTRGEDFQVFVL